jgi:hypothetical protein
VARHVQLDVIFNNAGIGGNLYGRCSAPQTLKAAIIVNAKTRSNTRHGFYVENPCGKKSQRQSAIFTMMRELQRTEYNEPS